MLFYVYVVGAICCIPFRCCLLKGFGVVWLFGFGCLLVWSWLCWLCIVWFGWGLDLWCWCFVCLGGVSVVLVRACFWLFYAYVWPLLCGFEFVVDLWMVVCVLGCCFGFRVWMLSVAGCLLFGFWCSGLWCVLQLIVFGLSLWFAIACFSG